jgi:competence protein ComEC
MAISGMHVGMLALVGAWFASRVQRWRQRRGALGAGRDAAVVAGSLTALAYAALAGWSVPTQRTVIMISVVAVALRLRRRLGAADALALGAIAVLLLEPLAPLSVGFWLSFGAVAAILLVCVGHLSRPGILRGYTQAQLAVSVGLVPVLVGCFGSLSLVSALVNVIAIPLYTVVIVPAVLIATALVLLLPAVGGTALAAVAWLIESTWPVISLPASWSIATWGMAGLPPLGWCALVTGAVAALLPLPVPGRLAGVMIVAALGGWRAEPPEEGALHFAMLDVGQGLAAVIETRRHVLVYDTGPAFRSGSAAGVLAVEPYLRHRGLRRVDMLVASHDDNDHAGGAATLANLLPVVRRAASGRALDALGTVERCRAGDSWSWDGVRFDWLHPAAELLPNDNDRSCILRVRAGSHVLLLPGDAERAAEAELLARGGLGPVDVLVVPHHGSRSSSSESFVAATRPSWALVAAGHRNRWGFPVAPVVERWQDAGANLLVSARSGAIEFDVHPDHPLEAPRQWRIERRRFWQDP